MNARRVLVVGLSLAVVASACSSISSNDGATHNAAVGLRLLAPSDSPGTPNPTNCTTNDATARSFAPVGAPPAPGQMPAGSYMAAIQRRGYLIAGVDQNTLGFGYRDPNYEIKGFDVEIATAIATAIFGTPNIRLRAVTTAERQTAVEKGQVDLVASLFSITCDRWQKFDFSTEYYAAKQGVLVPLHSTIEHVSDLNGKRVCATKTSTSKDQIHKFAPRAIIDAVDLRPECLVHLEEGKADAITSDDTILYGLQIQDPGNTRILDVDLHQPERYGIAINQAHPDFVRFVNGVLDQIRSDGRWEEYHHDLELQLHIPPAAPPPPLYGRKP
jgi:polar amino acid transport system substrate-binding protein